MGLLGGVGAAIEKALVKTLPQAHETSEEDELLSYLKWASSKWIVLIVIDNYQFFRFSGQRIFPLSISNDRKPTQSYFY